MMSGHCTARLGAFFVVSCSILDADAKNLKRKKHEHETQKSLPHDIRLPPLRRAWTSWSYLPANQLGSRRVMSPASSAARCRRYFG